MDDLIRAAELIESSEQKQTTSPTATQAKRRTVDEPQNAPIKVETLDLNVCFHSEQRF